jgi:hypothetical protein
MAVNRSTNAKGAKDERGKMVFVLGTSLSPNHSDSCGVYAGADRGLFVALAVCQRYWCRFDVLDSCYKNHFLLASL